MMAAVYNYSQARQNLAALLEQAIKDGEVRIKRKDGQIFVVRPDFRQASPLDIEGAPLNISTDELVALIREGRESRPFDR
jgi:antitoxin Phd